MNKVVPEKLINYRVYDDGNDLLGTTDVELPSIKNMTETVKGAGVAGEIDSPTMGHYASMEVTLTWRTIMKANVQFAGTQVKHFEIRGSQQIFDAGKKQYRTVPVNCVIEGTQKETKLGKFEVGATTGTTTTLEVHYIKLIVDGEIVLEIDKYNFIANIGTTDYLVSVRKDLGL